MEQQFLDTWVPGLRNSGSEGWQQQQQCMSVSSWSREPWRLAPAERCRAVALERLREFPTYVRSLRTMNHEQIHFPLQCAIQQVCLSVQGSAHPVAASDWLNIGGEKGTVCTQVFPSLSSCYDNVPITCGPRPAPFSDNSWLTWSWKGAVRCNSLSVAPGPLGLSLQVLQSPESEPSAGPLWPHHCQTQP